VETVLLLAAFPPELESAPAELRTAAVGIGLVDAAIGTAKVARDRPAGSKHAILVGTCGAYPGSGLAIGDVVVGSRVFLADAGVSLGHGALVGSMGAPLALDASLRARLAGGAREVDVATTLAITTDDALAASLARTTACAVEHLEAFAVARACQDAGLSLAVVLGVANEVGSRGRAEWQQNHRRAAANAIAYVVDGLRSSTTAPSRA
jgi:futalosine hydrolase